jgi:hypothetical protein
MSVEEGESGEDLGGGYDGGQRGSSGARRGGSHGDVEVDAEEWARAAWTWRRSVRRWRIRQRSARGRSRRHGGKHGGAGTRDVDSMVDPIALCEDPAVDLMAFSLLGWCRRGGGRGAGVGVAGK